MYPICTSGDLWTGDPSGERYYRGGATIENRNFLIFTNFNARHLQRFFPQNMLWALPSLTQGSIQSPTPFRWGMKGLWTTSQSPISRGLHRVYLCWFPRLNFSRIFWAQIGGPIISPEVISSLHGSLLPSMSTLWSSIHLRGFLIKSIFALLSAFLALLHTCSFS